jgi:hypothetical protein
MPSSALYIVQKYFPSVTKVTDADEDITIEVVSDDSSKGAIKDHEHCAFARACQRKFSAKGVIVSVNTAYVIMKGGAVRYKLPESVSREVVSFDRKGGFAEGTYILKAPNKSMRLGARRGRAGGGTHKPKGGKPRKFHYTTGIRAMLKGGDQVSAD